jgi:hypothetical protein
MPDSPKLTDALPTDALKNAGSTLLSLVVQRAAEAATDRVTSLTDRLNGVAENGGTGLRDAFRGGSGGDDENDDKSDNDDGDGDGGGGFFSGLKDKVSGLFGGGGGGGGGGKKLKVTQIVEDHDIGLPLRTTYNLWTQFGDFPSFMKKVESVDQTSDEKSTWKAQVFLSHREWEATIIEQVPDSHIVWRSSGAKGHVDGAVTFTSLGPNLTKVCLVLEYYPQGLFERTGNIWRAQGRRARLEFQHFKRHAMTNVLIRQDEVEGWRGEIRDSEVVKTHEEALEEEDRAREDDARPADDEPEDDVEYADEDYDDETDDEPDDEPEDEADYADEDADAEAEDDEPVDEEPADDEPADDEPADDEPADDEPVDEDYDDTDEFEDEQDDAPDEPEEAPRRGRRRPATSGARGRG